MEIINANMLNGNLGITPLCAGKGNEDWCDGFICSCVSACGCVNAGGGGGCNSMPNDEHCMR